MKEICIIDICVICHMCHMCHKMVQSADIVEGQNSVLETLRYRGLQSIICVDC